MTETKEIIGIQKLDYTSRRTGNAVKGANFYFLRDSVPHSVGRIPASIFFNDDMLNGVPLRAGKYEFEYNVNGRYINYVSVKAL